MNSLGYYGFKTDIENHRNSSNTAAYYLLLYKKLRVMGQNLLNYFEGLEAEQKIKSPYRSNSLMLRRQVSEAKEIVRGRRLTGSGQNEEEEFLDRISFRNRKRVKERRSLNIRVRKVTS